QLKHRFYTPALLARILIEEQLPAVVGIQNIPLPPGVGAVRLSPDGRSLTMQLSNRGGGLGRVVVRVNHREIQATSRGPVVDSAAQQATLTVPLDEAVTRSDGRNVIEIRAFDARQLIASRGFQ